MLFPLAHRSICAERQARRETRSDDDDAEGINSAAKLIWMKPVVDRGCLTLTPAARRLARHRRRGGHTVRFILDKRRTVVVVVLSWKENIPVKQPVDVSGAASPGGGPRWTPARIWRKKLNPVHTLPGRY